LEICLVRLLDALENAFPVLLTLIRLIQIQNYWCGCFTVWLNTLLYVPLL